MKGQIFISYRREDSRGSTGRIYDRLLQKFSPEQIFMDVDTIEPGEDFVLAIEKAVSECDVLIAVIGRNWLRVVDKNGQRLLDSTNDFVRLEIKAALERNVRVIPLLVDKATMPEQEFLPEDIKIFSRRNAMEISHTRFNTDMEQLISALANILEKKAKEEQLKNNAKKDKEQKKRIAQQKEEALYWKRIEAENTKKAYSRYQNSYPNGKYFLEAGRKIRLLQKEEDQLKREAIRKVEALWYKCNQKNTIASYSDYLQTYPEGKYSDRARTKLQSLQELQKERTVLTRLNKRKVGKISNVFDTNNGTYKKLLDFVKQKKYELIALSAIIIGVIGAVSFYVGSASMENDEKSIVKRNIEFLSAHNINAYSADFSSDAILYEFFKDSIGRKISTISI
ncbi:MAG: toll/interleukin-1 receptor domain-containing protein, partial [Bacteroidota bacterium]